MNFSINKGIDSISSIKSIIPSSRSIVSGTNSLGESLEGLEDSALSRFNCTLENDIK